MSYRFSTRTEVTLACQVIMPLLEAAIAQGVAKALEERDVRIKEEQAEHLKKLEIQAELPRNDYWDPLPRNDERYHHDPSKYYWDPSTRRYEEKRDYCSKARPCGYCAKCSA